MSREWSKVPATPAIVPFQRTFTVIHAAVKSPCIRSGIKKKEKKKTFMQLGRYARETEEEVKDLASYTRTSLISLLCERPIFRSRTGTKYAATVAPGRKQQRTILAQVLINVTLSKVLLSILKF